MRPARRIVATLLLVAGACLMLYPLVGTFLNEHSFTEAVARYDDEVQSIPENQRQAMLAEAHAYNDNLRGDPVHDPFIANSGWALPDDYGRVLDVDGKGLMGTLSIPRISTVLPIYHGTASEVLERGVGHISQTSLPVGGAGTHAVLTGHTGLPAARLFTDLVQLEIGDVFILNVLGEKRAYAVDDIRVVEPQDVSAIRVDETHDYVTLLTCTPYGLNTQRLLVRGAPCALPSDETLSNLKAPFPWGLSVGAFALVAASAAAVIVLARRRKGKG